MDYYDLSVNQAILVSQKVLLIQNDKLLVIKNSKNEFVKNVQWELPGGFLEMNEDLEEALIREIREEIGLEIFLAKPLTTWSHLVPKFKVKDGRELEIRVVEIAYFGEIVSGEISLGLEHQDYKWAAKRELQELNFAENSQKAIEAYLKLN